VASWDEADRGPTASKPPEFWVVGNLLEILLVRKLSSRNAKFKQTPPILEKFDGKIEILSTHDHLRQKFVAACGKIATFFSAYTV